MDNIVITKGIEVRNCMMKSVWYTAREKFDPIRGEGWNNYLAWAKLPQLIEVVSLDYNLCPPVIKGFSPEDRKHMTSKFFETETDFFEDLEYLLKRVADFPSINILCIIEEPNIKDLEAYQDDRFDFKGFDLIELPGTGISALTDCGGFDLAFQPNDINEFGLISNYYAAREVQERLVEKYPDEHHADCSLWAVWRMEK